VADQKPTNRERVKEIVAGIEQNIQELFQSEMYLDYLRTMSRFHSYSVNNTILIHMQRPHAAQPVAGFHKWKQFGRHVKKGERGLTIIAPTPLKKKIEEMKLDPDTRAPVLDEDGNVIMEERTVEIPLFKPVKVFSADQTEGKPLPSLASDLTGDVRQYEAFMEALRRTSPVPIEIKPLAPSTDGVFSNSTQSITIREGMSEVQTVCATVHEMAHAVLHNRERDRLAAAAGTDMEPPKAKDTSTKEVEAESVSFAVCQYYGIDTSANSLGYIATWSKDRSLPELRASLETITKTVSSLISGIDHHFAEICMERGIDLTAQQPEQKDPELPDTPERFISDMLDMMDSLYEAGITSRNFPPENRELIHANLVGVLHINTHIVREALEQLVREDTGAEEARGMLARLDGLVQSVPLKEYVCKLEDNPRPVGTEDRCLIQAYVRTNQGTLEPERVLFAGTAEVCARLLKKLRESNLQPGDFFHAALAGSGPFQYAARDGAVMCPFLDDDGRVYLGRKEHYDNHGHYINADNSLVYISDNERIFSLLSGTGYGYTQAELVEQDFFTQGDYAEFEALRTGVLAQFEQIERPLFAGEPFRFVQPDTPEPVSPSASQWEEAVQPELPDTRLDEYPLPDASLAADDLVKLGYSGGDLLPLSRYRAEALLQQDMTIYTIETGENPEMVFDQEDLMERPEGAMFAVPREEWEASPTFQQAVAERMDRQEERERAFLDHRGDCFAIYQLRDDPSLRDICFESLDWLRSKGREVERGSYDLIYTAPLSSEGGSDAALDQLWYKFNNEHPADYQHPSVSVSDIIAIRQDGVLSFHYCDSFGFQQLPDFIQPENAPENKELPAGRLERGEKKSVLARLNAAPPQQEHRKSAPKKSAGKER